MEEEFSEDTVCIGALSLDGTVEKVEGILPALIAAKTLGFKRVYLPFDSLIPLEMFQGLECIVIQHIHEVIQHLSGRGLLPLHKPSQPIHRSFFSYSSRNNGQLCSNQNQSLGKNNL